MSDEYNAMEKLKKEIREIDHQINKCHEEWWEAQVANDWLDKDRSPKAFTPEDEKENKRFQSALLDSIVNETTLIGKRNELIEETIGKGVSQFFPCKAKVWDNITYGRTLEGLDTHLKLWAWIKYRILCHEIPKLTPNNFDGFLPNTDTVRFVDHCLKKIGSCIRLGDEMESAKEGKDISHLLATIVQKLEDEVKPNIPETAVLKGKMTTNEIIRFVNCPKENQAKLRSYLNRNRNCQACRIESEGGSRSNEIVYELSRMRAEIDYMREKYGK